MVQRIAYDYRAGIGKATVSDSPESLDVREIVSVFRAIDGKVKLIRIYAQDRLLGSVNRTSSETSRWYGTLANGTHVSLRF